jgi:hypothetical protein
MAGLVPAIHVLFDAPIRKTWMPGKAGHDEKTHIQESRS